MSIAWKGSVKDTGQLMIFNGFNERDFFYENLAPLPGDSASGDKIMLITKTGNIKFPKLSLSPATVSVIQSLW